MKRDDQKSQTEREQMSETKSGSCCFSGLLRSCGDYFSNLKATSLHMDARGQQELHRSYKLMAVGAAIVTAAIWCFIVPSNMRVVLLLPFLVFAWWLGTKIVQYK